MRVGCRSLVWSASLHERYTKSLGAQVFDVVVVVLENVGVVGDGECREGENGGDPSDRERFYVAWPVVMFEPVTS